MENLTEINRSVGGLHILPDKSITEDEYKQIRALIEKIHKFVEEQMAFFEGDSFVCSYNLFPQTHLSVYAKKGFPVLIGICYTIKKENEIFYRISQICSVSQLSLLLTKTEEDLTNRYKDFMDNINNPKRQHLTPKGIYEAWERHRELISQDFPELVRKNSKVIPQFPDEVRWKYSKAPNITGAAKINQKKNLKK